MTCTKCFGKGYTESVEPGIFMPTANVRRACDCVKNAIQTETPEEKEALDSLSTENFIFVGSPEKFSEFKAKWEGFDTTPAKFESLAVEVNSEPVWNGEGLPPVGVECEYEINGCGQWHKMTSIRPSENAQGVLANTHHGEQWFNSNPISKGTVVKFRPIETPEQKAAREREEAISEMVGHAWKDQCVIECTRFAESLYDAGYRKPE